MRTLKTILIMAVMVASLCTAAGTAWARSDSGQRGTAWTDGDGLTLLSDPSGISWELFGLGFAF